MDEVIALIPARGGSKRIPRKNIKPFCGKPLIAYSIEAAIQAACFDRVIVSTDDDEIAAVARDYGAQTPFTRPADLANDFCVIDAVVEHCFNWIEASGSSIAKLCCIYATAPMISSDDVRTGLQRIQEDSSAREALAVTHFPFPIQRAQCLTPEGYLQWAQPEHRSTRSQDLEERYHDAGQFVWINYEVPPTRSAGCRPVFVDRYRVQDIDTEEDWENAEYLYEVFKSRQHAANKTPS